MTTDHQEAEKNAKALLKFALGNHNAKRYQEAAGFYEVILKQYPDTEAAKYAKTNLSSLVNKIDGLEAIWPDKILIARIEQQSTSSEPTQNLASPPTVELSKPLPIAPKPPQDTTASASKRQHRIHFKWKQLRITENPYLLAGLFFLTALTGYFVGREHVKYEIRQIVTGAAAGQTDTEAEAAKNADTFLAALKIADIPEGRQILAAATWRPLYSIPAVLEYTTLYQGMFDTDVPGVRGYKRILVVKVQSKAMTVLTTRYILVSYKDSKTNIWKVFGFQDIAGTSVEETIGFYRRTGEPSPYWLTLGGKLQEAQRAMIASNWQDKQDFEVLRSVIGQ